MSEKVLWFGLGLLVGWIGVPMVLGLVSKKSA